MTEMLRRNLEDLSQAVVQVDLSNRVQRGTRRATMRRRLLTFMTIVALAAGAGVFGAFAAAWVAPPVGVEPTTDLPSPTATDGVGPLPAPDPSPVAAGAWSNEADPGPDRTLDGASLQIPPWPGADPAQACSGEVTLSAGVYSFTGGYSFGGRLPRQVRLVKAVPVHGPAGVIALFYCHLGESGHQFQVVDYRRDAGGALRPRGVVLASRPGGVEAMFDIAVAGSEVRIEVGDWADTLTVNEASHYSVHQWRAYQWVPPGYVQVGGPTTFAANPNFYDLAISVAPARFAASQDGLRRATMAVTVRNLGTGLAPRSIVRFDLPGALVLATPSAAKCPGGVSTIDLAGNLRRYTCAIGRLAPGTTYDLSVGVSAAADVDADLANFASVGVAADPTETVGRADTDGSNDTAKIVVTII